MGLWKEGSFGLGWSLGGDAELMADSAMIARVVVKRPEDRTRDDEAGICLCHLLVVGPWIVTQSLSLCLLSAG